jgi:hypothetical protein
MRRSRVSLLLTPRRAAVEAGAADLAGFEQVNLAAIQRESHQRIWVPS